MIYAIEAVGTGFIKIGKAGRVGKRLRELECACPHELAILAVADWPDGSEPAIHLYLRSEWERGEWFRDGPKIKEVLSWMVNGQAGLERLRAELPMKRERSWVEPVESVTKRRAEREAWWKAREALHG